MMVIDAVAFVAAVLGAEVVPGGGGDILAPVFGPFDVGFVAQHAGAFLFYVADSHEGADVEAHAVVEVRVPADGLLVERFPADKDIVGGLAFKDQFQFPFQVLGGGQFLLGSVGTGGDIVFPAVDPVTEIGVDQGFQVLVVQLVVVDENGKAVGQTVPDMPDKGAVMEELAVLGKELVPQPGFQGLALVICCGKQGVEDVG